MGQTSLQHDQRRVIVSMTRGWPESIDQTAALSRPNQRFLNRGWFEAATTAYHGHRGHTLTAARPDGRPIISVPLTHGHHPLLPDRTVPGCYWPFRSFPVAEDTTVEEMTQFLRDRQSRQAMGALCRIGPMLEDDPALILLRQAAPRAGWHLLQRHAGTSFVLELEAIRTAHGWPRPSTLKRMRYAEGQLAQLGDLRWACFRGTSLSPEVFNDMTRVERNSWVGRRTDRSGAKFLAPAHRRFWQAFAAISAADEHVSAALLYVGSRPVAFSLDLNCPPFKYVIANSYDEEFAKHSPGKLLAYRNLYAAAESGTRHVDWGSGDSGYKQAIGATPGPTLVDCLLLRGGAVGNIAAAAIRRLWERATR